MPLGGSARQQPGGGAWLPETNRKRRGARGCSAWAAACWAAGEGQQAREGALGRARPRGEGERVLAGWFSFFPFF